MESPWMLIAVDVDAINIQTDLIVVAVLFYGSRMFQIHQPNPVALLDSGFI